MHQVNTEQLLTLIGEQQVQIRVLLSQIETLKQDLAKRSASEVNPGYPGTPPAEPAAHHTV